jgi:hypothetical protein
MYVDVYIYIYIYECERAVLVLVCVCECARAVVPTCLSVSWEWWLLCRFFSSCLNCACAFVCVCVFVLSYVRDLGHLLFVEMVA